MRLINADALAMHLADWQLSSGEEERDVIEEAIRAINEAPTIDAVPVVRCKDCKCSNVYQVDSDFKMERWCDGGFIPKSVQDDDYCSWGERKDNETN